MSLFKGRIFNYPVTHVDHYGTVILAGAPGIAVTNTPLLPKYSEAKTGMYTGRTVMLDPALTAGQPSTTQALASTIQYADKNALIGVLQAMDFVDAVFAPDYIRSLEEDPTMSHRRVVEYVTLLIPSTLNAVRLAGTSLGLASVFVFLGYSTPRSDDGNVLLCSTGYISNIGNPYQGIAALTKMRISPIDSVIEKIYGCLTNGVNLIFPRENLNMIFSEMKWQMNPYSKDGNPRAYKPVTIRGLVFNVRRIEGVGSGEILALVHRSGNREYFAYAPDLVIDALHILEVKYECRSKLVDLGLGPE